MPSPQRTHLLPAVGRRVRLEPLGWEHLDAIWRLVCSPEAHAEWPLRGRTIDPTAMLTELWEHAVVTYAIVRRRRDEVVGFVQASVDHPRYQPTEVAAFIDPELWSAAWPLEGVILFIHWLFAALAVQQIEMKVPQHVHERLSSGAAHGLKEHVRLIDHVQMRDGYEDLVILVLDVEDWDLDLVQRITPRS